ncbi:MAG: hypothetical protein ACHQ15_05660 [Candidatus Limnocylindrales bacterium]
MKPKIRKETQDKAPDVEGQGFLLDPTAGRHTIHDRTKDLERSPGERARHKEARPNREHQR